MWIFFNCFCSTTIYWSICFLWILTWNIQFQIVVCIYLIWYRFVNFVFCRNWLLYFRSFALQQQLHQKSQTYVILVMVTEALVWIAQVCQTDQPCTICAMFATAAIGRVETVEVCRTDRQCMMRVMFATETRAAVTIARALWTVQQCTMYATCVMATAARATTAPACRMVLMFTTCVMCATVTEICVWTAVAKWTARPCTMYATFATATAAPVQIA